MAKRRVNTYLELDGPIFDPNLAKRVDDALAKGIEDLTEEGAEVLSGFISGGGFVKSGHFLRSVEGELHRSRGAGYGKIGVSGQYPSPGRPTKTWMEEGRRGGVRMRRGIYAFRKTKAHMNRVKYEGYFLPALQRALG